MIKGLIVRTDAPPIPESTLQPSSIISPNEADSFRRSFTPAEPEPPIPATEIGLQMIPEALTAAPVIAATLAEQSGGEQRSLSKYSTQVLLWVAERAGADALNPRCIVTVSGDYAQTLPGGWIVVGGDLFALLQDEAELAGVLGHELCHAVFNHGRTALEKEAWRLGVDQTFAELEAEASPDCVDVADLQAFAEFARNQMRRRWSLADELQADSASTVWLARCGYDPEGLERVLQRMRSEMGRGLVGHGDISLAWLYSRDELDARLEKLAKQTNKLKRKYEGGQRFENRFNTQLK